VVFLDVKPSTTACCCTFTCKTVVFLWS